MADINQAKLLKAVKDGLTHGKAAAELGLTPGQLPMLTYCKAVVEAGLAKKAPATPKSVMTLRDKEGNRWELIAARTGLSVKAVKDKYVEAGGDPQTSFTGKGRNFSNVERKAPAAKPAAAKPRGRQSGSKPAAAAKPKGRQSGGRKSGSKNPS